MSYRDKNGHWVYTGLSPFSEEDDVATDATKDDLTDNEALKE